MEPKALEGSVYAAYRYLLRVILAGVDGTEGDVLDAVILTALIDLNIGYLDDRPALAWRHATYDHGPPDGYRRPAPISAVAARLGIPHETARRRIEALIVRGACLRTDKGVHAPLIRTQEHRAASLANYAAVRNLRRDLQTRIPEIAWPGDDAFTPEDPDPPLRLVNRRSGAYAVDALAALADLCGDYGAALVYMAVVESTGRGAAHGVWPILRTSSLARSLELPIPSVRRRIGVLRERGLITGVGSGFTARPGQAAEADVSRLAIANLRRLHQLFSELGKPVGQPSRPVGPDTAQRSNAPISQLTPPGPD